MATSFGSSPGVRRDFGSLALTPENPDFGVNRCEHYIFLFSILTIVFRTDGNIKLEMDGYQIDAKECKEKTHKCAVTDELLEEGEMSYASLLTLPGKEDQEFTKCKSPCTDDGGGHPTTNMFEGGGDALLGSLISGIKDECSKPPTGQKIKLTVLYICLKDEWDYCSKATCDKFKKLKFGDGLFSEGFTGSDKIIDKLNDQLLDGDAVCAALGGLDCLFNDDGTIKEGSMDTFAKCWEDIIGGMLSFTGWPGLVAAWATGNMTEWAEGKLDDLNKCVCPENK